MYIWLPRQQIFSRICSILALAILLVAHPIVSLFGSVCPAREKPFALQDSMSAVPGFSGCCFNRNAREWHVHIRQSMQTSLQSRFVRCQAQRNAEPPQKSDARGIFEMSPPCCEATLLDARSAACICSLQRLPFLCVRLEYEDRYFSTGCHVQSAFHHACVQPSSINEAAEMTCTTYILMACDCHLATEMPWRHAASLMRVVRRPAMPNLAVTGSVWSATLLQ